MRDVVDVKKSENSNNENSPKGPKKTRRIWLWFFVILLIIAIVGFVLALFTEDSGINIDIGDFMLQYNGNSNGLNDNNSHALAQQEVLELRDSAVVSDLKITANAARLSDGDEFVGPGEDEMWLVVDISIENLNEHPVIISSLLMFELIDQEGRSRSNVLFADTKGGIDGELGSGREIRGEMAFSVGEDQDEWMLIFNPEVIGVEQVAFIITEDVIE